VISTVKKNQGVFLDNIGNIIFIHREFFLRIQVICPVRQKEEAMIILIGASPCAGAGKISNHTRQTKLAVPKQTHRIG
jgi:hypothetical protein